MKKKNYSFNLMRFGRLCLFTAALLFSATAFSAITTGLVLHYDFEGISGTTVPDVSGNSNDGVLNGAAAATTGQTGQGVICTAKADFVQLPANITSSLTSFTLAAWVYADGTTVATRIFDFGSSTTGTTNWLALVPRISTGGPIRLRYRATNGTSQDLTSGTVQLPASTWTHVAVTYTWNATTSTGTGVLYLNGEVVGTNTAMTFTPAMIGAGSTNQNYIAKSQWTADPGANESLDDARIYNRALEAVEIKELAGKSIPSELVAQYNALTLGDISAVSSNLNLPITMGTQGVTVKWKSSNKAVIDTLGNVNPFKTKDASVDLTATLSQTAGGTLYTLDKIFAAKVPAKSEIATQYRALDLGNLSDVKTNLTLPTTLGSQGVAVVWVSNHKNVIDSLGNVVIPSKFKKTVVLTANLSMLIADSTYKMVKTFTAIVNPPVGVTLPDEVAKWNFIPENISTTAGTVTVKDEFETGFVGTVKNDARIRTIGSTTATQYNVLDLGNGTGYFDMGAAIGEDIYSLSDYTMSAYFRIDNSYTELNSAGNFLWNFSNASDVSTAKNGYIIGTLKSQDMSITPGYYDATSGNQACSVGSNAPKATINRADKIGWHHMAYVQSGTIGTVFIDGVIAKTTTITNIPSAVLPKAGLDGTPYNWIGHSCYPGDKYLRKTLVYGFSLYRIPMDEGNLTNFLNVPSTITALNEAYAQDSDYVDVAFKNEVDGLTLGDLTAVTSNITLPAKGSIDNTISISWKSNVTDVISNTGAVTRPDAYNANVTLTATLSRGTKIATKAFKATVLYKPGSEFVGDLIVNYDFTKAENDSVVTDAAEKHFTGIAKQGAKIITIGKTAPVKVLALSDVLTGKGYFDMGSKMGSAVSHLTNYTMSAYFRIDSTYSAELTKAGNFLWNFSNSANVGTDQNGYIIAVMGTTRQTISATYYANSAEQNVSMAAAAPINGWHHLAYTLQDSTGVLYLDGQPVAFAESTVNLNPMKALTKDGFNGTPYNWLGRSCYSADNYLRKTLISDFKLYKKALTLEEIMTASSNIAALDIAYNETKTTALNAVKDSPYKVISTVGCIKILGLTGAEKISIYDIAGRQLRVNNTATINAKSGIYIVRINNYVTKVIVR